MKARNKHFQVIQMTLLGVLLLGFSATTGFAQIYQSVIWDRNEVNQTIGKGIASPTTVRFRVTSSMTNVKVASGLQAEGFLNFTPSDFPILLPGIEYELTINYSLPQQTVEKVYEDRIFLRGGSKRIVSDPLKIRLTVDYGGNIPSPSVKTLSQNSLNLISGVAPNGNGLYFSQINSELSQISPGTILALPPAPALPNGFFGKVTDIYRTNNQLSVVAAPASLSEAFVKASLNVSQALSEENLSSATALAEGVSIQPKSLKSNSRAVALENTGFSFRLDDLKMLQSGTGKLSLNGGITINPQLNFSIDFDGLSLKQLSSSVELNQTAELKVKGTLEAPFLDIEKEFFRTRLTPITVWVGIVPIVLTPELSFFARVKGGVVVGVEFGISQAANATLGAGYSNGRAYPIANFSSSSSINPPMLTDGVKLKGQVGPRFKLLVYGVVGPKAELSTFGELDVDIPRNPDWQIFGGLEGSSGINFGVFDQAISDVDFPFLIQYGILIAQGNFRGEGRIVGSVRDAVTEQALPDSVINVYRNNNLEDTVLTDSTGKFEIEALTEAVYRFEISRSGYLPVTYNDVTIFPDETKTLDVILQIDEDNAGNGNVSGAVFNAISGEGVSGLTINLRQGMNTTSGAIVRTTTTGAGGAYSFTNLPAGNYTAEASGDGFTTTYFSILSIGNMTRGNQNGVITPNLPGEQIRIVLTWGATPADLDSHFFGPLPGGGRFHMYYPFAGGASPYPSIVKLDLDDTTSFGPETTTLFQQIDGVYKFVVHDFTNRNSTSSSALSQSQAQVRVYRGSNLIGIFNVPLGQLGTTWTVFELEGSTLRPINQMGFSSTPTGFLTQAEDSLQNLPSKP